MTESEKKQLHRMVFAAAYVEYFMEKRANHYAHDYALKLVSENGGAESAYLIADRAVIDYEAWSPGGSAAG